VLFIEASTFTRLVHDYLDDDEYAALQWALALRPEAGAIIPGSGGIRKLRWAVKGRGKRGGPPGDLLLAQPRGRNRAAHALRQERGRKHSAQRAAGNAEGDQDMTKKRNIGQEILEGLRAVKRGKGRRIEVKLPDNVQAIRERTGLSQSAFAALLGVSTRTLQEWEQGRRQPTGPARAASHGGS